MESGDEVENERWEGSLDEDKPEMSPKSGGGGLKGTNSLGQEMKLNPFLSGSNSKESKDMVPKGALWSGALDEKEELQKPQGVRVSAHLENIKQEEEAGDFKDHGSAEYASFGKKPSGNVLQEEEEVQFESPEVKGNNLVFDYSPEGEEEEPYNGKPRSSGEDSRLRASGEINEYQPLKQETEPDRISGAGHEGEISEGVSPNDFKRKLPSPKQSLNEDDAQETPPKVLESPSQQNDTETRRNIQGFPELKLGGGLSQQNDQKSSPRQDMMVRTPPKITPRQGDKKDGMENQTSKETEKEEEIDIFALDDDLEEQKLKKKIFYRILENWVFSTFVGIVTVYSLFSDDFKVLIFEKSADTTFNILNIIAFLVFIFEILASCLGKSGYLWSFFFWLDIISTVSILLDITWLAETILNGGGYFFHVSC